MQQLVEQALQYCPSAMLRGLAMGQHQKGRGPHL